MASPTTSRNAKMTESIKEFNVAFGKVLSERMNAVKNTVQQMPGKT